MAVAYLIINRRTEVSFNVLSDHGVYTCHGCCVTRRWLMLEGEVFGQSQYGDKRPKQGSSLHG